MIKLSVVVITFNEQEQIGRCIDSVQGIADEIIVLDSYSNDQTESICLEKGAIFHQHTFDGYIEQKNRAMALASFDYVLSLDADESLSEKLRDSISAVKQNCKSEGFTMNRLTNYCGAWVKHCGWYPDTKLRLVNRHKARWEGINPHDELVLKEGITQHLEGDILHYSYKSISDHVIQANKFTDISAQMLFQKGIKAPLWKILIKPPVMFVKSYFIKAGFMDGYYGYLICRISANATFLKYAKLRHKWMVR